MTAVDRTATGRTATGRTATDRTATGRTATDRTATDRRTFLRHAALGVGATLLAGAGAGSAIAGPWRRPKVYVLVVDGLRPDEVERGLMPTLLQLRNEGTSYSSAQAVLVAETIPNHVAMMTGVFPDRNGVPANDIFDPATGEVVHPTDISAPTVLEHATAAGLVTGTVLSKRYLYDIFQGKADHQWAGDEPPQPNIPVSDHVPDAFTMTAALEMIDAHDPDLLFVNLGDVDRTGHVDETGPLVPEAQRTVSPGSGEDLPPAPIVRSAVLASTDRQLRRFVDHLTSTGRWHSSVVLVVADHSMDWSVPHNVVSLTSAFDRARLARDAYVVVQNGGAALVYVTGGSREDVLPRMRTAAIGAPGVASVHAPGQLRLGPEAGDLVAFVHPGWRFTEPATWSNPIPGNHGHAVTRTIPFVVGGGHGIVRRGVRIDRVTASNLDVAPTAAWLLGLRNLTAGGRAVDGSVRREAFHAPGSVRRHA